MHSDVLFIQMYIGNDPQQIARVRNDQWGLLCTADFCHLQAGVYFTQVDSDGPSKYVPRSVQVDLESGVCNRVSMFAFNRYRRC